MGLTPVEYWLAMQHVMKRKKPKVTSEMEEIEYVELSPEASAELYQEHKEEVSPESCKSFYPATENGPVPYGWVDLRHVNDYLKLRDAGEIARLAAMLASRSTEFDVGALVNAAFALQKEAESRLIDQRNKIVGCMNIITMKALAKELGIPVDPAYYDHLELFCVDPVVRPLALRFHEIYRESMRPDPKPDPPSVDEECLRNLEEALENSDRRTKIERPELPCELEEALRYTADAPKSRVPWNVLKNAYREFLVVFDPVTIERERNHERYLQAGLDSITESLKLPLYPEALRCAEENIAQIKSELSEIADVRKIRKTFVPGMEVPQEMRDEANAIFAYHAKAPVFGMHQRMLRLLNSGFYGFWKKHKVYFECKVKESENRSRKGPKTRDHDKWIDITLSFVQSPAFQTFLNLGESRLDRGDFATKVDGFLASLERDSRTKKKIKHFLVTLFGSRSSNMDPSDIRKISDVLEKHKILAVGDKTIIECHALLKSRLEGKETKKNGNRAKRR